MVRVSYRDLGLRQQTDDSGLYSYDAYVTEFKSDRRYKKIKDHFHILSATDATIAAASSNLNQFRLSEDIAHLQAHGVAQIQVE